MIDLILLLALPLLIIYGVTARIRRTKARTRADRIIDGQQRTNQAAINKCITILISRNSWLIGRSEQDLQRIEQLRNIRNSLISSH